jgi:hypothetical protein
MSSTVRIRAAVAVAAAALAISVVPSAAHAQSAPGLVGQAPAPGQITATIDGSKGPAGGAPSAGDPGAGTNAVGDVTISAQGCSVDPVALGGQTTCTYAVQNQTQTSTTVDLQATGDSELAVVGADQGAAVTGGTARAEDVPLPGRPSSPIQINPGSTFAGYYPLETIPIGPQTIADDQILNYTVQPFRWNGATYTSIGISANGYAVVGGADTTKDATAAPQDVPNASRPNNVLAPFWTDLTPAGGGSLRVATVANSAQAPCERSYWFVAQWDMVEFGTTTNRKAQLWIQADDPECATDPVPAETIYFTYDLSTMTAAPARPFRIAAEDATGTVGGMRPAGQLPTGNYVVTSSGTPQPAPVVTWKVVGEGRAAGTGTIASTVESSLIPGSSTVFSDVTVSPEAVPTITDDPDDLTVTAGDQAVFSAAATGASSVRWQVSTDDGGTWTDISGATATTLAFTAAGVDDGNWYRAVFVNGSGGETPTADALLAVDGIETTTSVTASPSAPTAGQAVTFTATVSPPGATGTVQFAVDGSALGGPVAVAGDGTATSSSISSLAPGDHVVTAAYSGDGDHEPSTGTGGVSVGKIATSVALDIDPAAPEVGDDVTFTATLSPSSAPGTITFLVDGAPLGDPVTPTAGVATSVPATGLAQGSHVVEAQYSGDATHAISSSGPEPFTVDRRPVTVITLETEPATPVRRSPVRYHVELSPAPDGGTVQFSIDGAPVGDPVPVTAGEATTPELSVPAAGTRQLGVAYSGDDVHAPVIDDTSITVAKLASTTTIGDQEPSIAGEGEDVSIPIAVAPAPLPGATVTVSVDGTALPGGLALGSDGTATATLTGLDAGSHDVDVSFAGDADLLSSDDDTTVVVDAPADALVERMYLVVLDRAADPSGLAYWSNRIEGGTDPGAVASALARGSEGRSAVVRDAYSEILGRTPDAGGRTFWSNRLASGTTVESMRATLLSAREGYAKAGGNPVGYVAALYELHLDRSASSSELSYWVRRLGSSPDEAARRRASLTIGRSAEATRRAVDRAEVAACGRLGASADQRADLSTAWARTGRHPRLLGGLALAGVCPPPGLPGTGTTAP